MLRFFAAAFVALYHLAFYNRVGPEMQANPLMAHFNVYEGLTPFFNTGWIGVQIFFVISGFVIAYTAFGRTPGAFLESRVARLVPGVAVCATAIVPVMLLSGDGLGETIRAYLMSLAFWPTGPWVTETFWTLPIEVIFYATIFMLIRFRRIDKLEWLAIGIGSASALGWVAYWVTMAPGVPGVLHQLVSLGLIRVGRFLLLEHGCFFALGVLMWLIAVRGVTRLRVVMATLMFAAGTLQVVAEAYRAAAWANYEAAPLTAAAIWVVAMGALIVSIAANGPINRVLGAHARTIRTLGLITFPLYLLHQPFGTLITGTLLASGVAPGMALVAGLVAVMLLSYLVAEHTEPLARRGVMRGMTALAAVPIPAIFQPARTRTALR
ncbi:acyltransferase family protein [Sphingomonas immobilis]|uniref:Acyltransferase n=1 Tax=Sphingomonas immobilis TaxID=3063997 RepID=A0ABT9A461_9SPHN|nr:acyltransferase [Sphingomonas sp. CA1-15]MDO7844631.1 acyltransferase [Sphingomonas sp. CA1-15]